MPTSALKAVRVLIERPLDEGEVLIGLQALEAVRLLELSDAQAQPRERVRVEKRVGDDHRVVAEVRREEEVGEAKERPGEDRPDLPRDERVERRQGAVAQERSSVELQEPLEANLIQSVAAHYREAVLVSLRDRTFGDGVGSVRPEPERWHLLRLE